MSWLDLLRGKQVVADPHGLTAALAERKANRAQYEAQARSDAARKGWETRRGQGA